MNNTASSVSPPPKVEETPSEGKAKPTTQDATKPAEKQVDKSLPKPPKPSESDKKAETADPPKPKEAKALKEEKSEQTAPSAPKPVAGSRNETRVRLHEHRESGQPDPSSI